ncbi:PsiF family protein [Dyella japonica]|uniref:Phosphate starvation-inducible protein PsiF n=1 Tax=Dyella japonica A8 TaxID=1217721 RepID=A0A075K0I1_9GAMM|nr:PsiF family protein [Dyella japonica]AIF47340.1 phosphate starvation-inducible protein PsiF [Dyella japonica A8]
MSSRLSLMVASVALAFAASTAFAAPQAASTSAPAKNAQQQRMTDCNKQATGKSGDERKAFMSSCLKGESPAAAPAKQTQQEKMKACNADPQAKALKGDARKTFMSTCLKGDAAPAAH